MQTTSHLNSTPSHWLLDILGLTVVITFFYFLWLGAYPLFTPDEGRYAEVAREMVASGNYITPTENGVVFLDKPILFYWLQSLAIHLFGLKEWVMRFCPALFGVMGCLMTYAAGRSLFDRYTGLLAAFIVALSPLYFGSAHYTNLDMELSTWISGSLFAFICGIHSRGPLRRYLFLTAYVFSAFAVLTKGLIGLAFPILITGTWILMLRRWDLLKKIHLLMGIGLMIALILPWYILVEKENPGYLYHFFINEQISRYLSAGTFNNKTPFWFFIPILIIGFFPWSIFLIQTLYKNTRLVISKKSPIELFLLLWIGIIFIFFSIPHSKIVTYILPIFPPLSLLVARYWISHFKNPKQRGVYFSIFFFFLVNLILIIGLLILHIKAYLPMMVIIFGLSAITSVFAIHRKTLFPLFLICVSWSVLSLLTFISRAEQLNLHSSKPLAIQLNTLLMPQDEVITYYDYPLDLPFYLKRHVAIVENWTSTHIIHTDNWTRELWRGMRFRNTDKFLISESTFWQRWNDSKRVFVILDKDRLGEFKSKTYSILGKSGDWVLIRN